MLQKDHEMHMLFIFPWNTMEIKPPANKSEIYRIQNAWNEIETRKKNKNKNIHRIKKQTILWRWHMHLYTIMSRKKNYT